MKVIANLRQQSVWAVRFGHKVVAAGRSRLLLFSTWRIGGDRDDWDRAQRSVGFRAYRRHMLASQGCLSSGKPAGR